MGRGRGRGRGGRGRGGSDAGWGGRVAPDENAEDEDEDETAPNGMSAGRGYGMAPAQSKLEALQTQLALRNIRIDVLPEGMERRKMNQSTWDPRFVITIFTACLK